MLKRRWVLKPFVTYHCWTKFWWDQKWHFSHHTLFVFSHLPRGFWAAILVLLIIKALKEKGWVLKVYLCGKVVWLLLKCCIYCASMPILHMESTDSLIKSCTLKRKPSKVQWLQAAREYEVKVLWRMVISLSLTTSEWLQAAREYEVKVLWRMVIPLSLTASRNQYVRWKWMC